MRQCAMPKCVKWVYAEHELALHRLRNAIRSNENNQTLVYRVSRMFIYAATASEECTKTEQKITPKKIIQRLKINEAHAIWAVSTSFSTLVGTL